MSKKDLRNHLLGKAPSFKKQTVNVDGTDYEVRQFSLGDRNKIASKVVDKDGNTDYTAIQIWSVIYSVFDPETGERIFEDADYEQLLKQPSAGSFIDKFTEAANDLSLDEEGKGESVSEETDNSNSNTQ